MNTFQMIGAVMKKTPNFEEVAKRIEEVWAERLKKTEVLSDTFPQVFKEAFDLINGLTKYGIVLKPEMVHETSHYNALLKIERNRNQQNTENAKKSRGDQLTKRIREIVSTQPDISVEDLITLLKSEKALGAIHDVENEEVVYQGKSESELKSCSIDALKDRLSRAKKQLQLKKEK
jgi:hypothetical protein